MTLDPGELRPKVGGGNLPLGVVSRQRLRSIYWATSDMRHAMDPSGLMRPRQLVQSDPRFAGVCTAIKSSERLAELAASWTDEPGQLTLGKLVAEAVFEEVRIRLQPSAPSRLNCVFAAPDGMSAMQFSNSYVPTQPELSGAMIAHTEGQRWIAVDMQHFAAPDNAQVEHHAFDVLAELRRRAEAYWRGERTTQPLIEILAEHLNREG